MNFNKPMIDLVREIRRRAASEQKPGIKLANPDLLYELIPLYRASADTIFKTLIKELFELAGEDWPERLQASAAATSEEGGRHYVTKVYRGKTELVEVPSTAKESDKPVRIYRGQVISS